MYALKRWLIKAGFFALLLPMLSGCGTEAQGDDDVLAILLQEGTLAAFSPEESSAFTHQLAPVWKGDIVVPWHSALELHFPNIYNVIFDAGDTAWHDARLLLGDMPDVGDEIEEGVFLASLTIGHDPGTEITRIDNAFMLQQFNTRFENENIRRLNEINMLRNQASFEQSQERTALVLAQRELEYDLFLLESERQRESLTQQQTTELRLYTPASGIVTHRTEASDGIMYRDMPTTVSSAIGPDGFAVQFHGRSIITILDDSNFYFHIEGRRDVFRFGEVLEARSLFLGGPVFDVIVVTDPLVRPVSRDGTQGILLRPADKYTFNHELEAHGLRPRDLPDIGFRVEAPMTLAADAVLTNTRAVHTEGVRNFVFVYDEGNLRRRYVDIGATHGDIVQILAGLEPGQQVVIP